MIVTKRIAGDGDPIRGYVFFEIDYDDANLRLTALRCINQSTDAAWGMAQQVSNNRVYDMRFPANATTVINIPTNASQRLNISILPNGKIDGVDYFFMWAYP